ncbi:CobW family GTP-binding protein [Candidatus Nitrospira allomarina]|jgi:cobalamin biosynthesis protein CobW|uniref:GTP-binding protein n=1 Tax=Candidatus Nitrospira allomarina TaxID=3020900 RepID=A0AA96GAU8_9BACT|nr:GTP-binding protein [Candidatus Nitrospira allomarina]WNM58644.1 GTP-binding protein [Candidatus Nitrospira allomarina]
MNNEKPEAVARTGKAGPDLGVPALVVSGFLGAGKTTLVKHLIADAQQQGLKLAVISNEFGELGIDRALLQEEGGPGYVELEGGCVCCQLSGELLNTLQNLWETICPDRVVVETSGVALPFETLLTFWREPVTEWVGESLAVVVVNAEQVAQKRDLEGTFEQQVSSADLLVINKVDLVPSDSVGRLETLLQEMAPGAPVIRSIQGKIDTTIVFPSLPEKKVSPNSQRKPELLPHTHEEFEAEELSFSDDLTPEQLIQQLQPLQALRIKGIVNTSEGPKLVQGVGSRIDLSSPPSQFPKEMLGRLVAIRRK